jgi:hypothetical protein
MRFDFLESVFFCRLGAAYCGYSFIAAFGNSLCGNGSVYRLLRFKKVYPNDPKKLAAVVLDFVDGNIIPVPDEGKK